MIEADALILHLNPLQEALQPEGDARWAGLLPRIETVARALDVPVIAKEVGWGISAAVARPDRMKSSRRRATLRRLPIMPM